MLFKGDAPQAQRQPKTDRLILARYLQEAVKRPEVIEGADAAHGILIKWADLESSGQLAQMHENQLQGEFLGDVFGNALGYTRFSDGAGRWTLEQHHGIGGQEPDAILGDFKPNKGREPRAIVELKGPRVHLDRDRSNGRTAVQQCWDYFAHTDRKCRWGVVSNLVSFRLYERDSTPRRYEHFSLQSLRDIETFRRFYCLFHVKGLVEKTVGQPPRAEALIDKSAKRQREVGDELYNDYSLHRTRLIDHLHREQGYSVEDAIEIVQRLLDRVIFIAFCEDRGLLPEHTIKRAHTEVSAFHAVTNPRWQNFKNLFRFLDKGHEPLGVPGYNGGLFAVSPADEVEIDDKWTNFFNRIGDYDFAEEVNLDVLGHLFERSITELERQRAAALFEGKPDKVEQYATMPQSAKRKRLGIYYTPQEFTSRIVRYTVEELISERLTDLAMQHDRALSREGAARTPPDTVAYWRAAIETIRKIKVVDPACGSGAFLFQAYEVLEHRYAEATGHLAALEDPQADNHAARIPEYILNDNLYGVDLSAEAVEITQLALWIRSAVPGRTLATLSHNIVHGNSLVHDPEVHPDGFDWKERFREVFDRPESGFDCVIGNPPWERLDLSEREFFSLSAPKIATATTGAKRKTLIAKLERDDPDLFALYQSTKAMIDSQRDYCRKSGSYPLTGKGRTNTYAVFAELASRVVAPRGRVGLLVPSGIVSDNTTQHFFASLVQTSRLIRVFDFENRTKKLFPEVDGRFKFCIFNFGGEETRHTQAEYVFFAHQMEDLEVRNRQITLSGEDIALLNPNTRTCPIFRTRRDAEITKAIYRRVPVLINLARKKTGNPWGVSFRQGLFNQTSDSSRFLEPAELKSDGFKLVGNQWRKGKKVCLPLYEAKMLQAFDHRAASVVTDLANWVRQGQTEATSLVSHQTPEYAPMPRFWVERTTVIEEAGTEFSHFLAFKDVTSPTNQRTMIAAMLPFVGVVNSAPLVLTKCSPRLETCLLANMNSFAYDFVSRQKVGNVHLNFFIVEQLPVLTPDAYTKPVPWEPKTKVTLEDWISERVLKLTCTAEDMLPLADACGFTGGSFKKEYGGRLHKWDPTDRANLMAELDAAYFYLYGIDRDDAEYILSTFSGVNEPNTLFGGASTAERILEMLDMFRMQAG